jgi:hypothetical protein
LIYEILNIPNKETEVNKVDEWDKYKEEIEKVIDEKMPGPESSFYVALSNLKKNYFQKKK